MPQSPPSTVRKKTERQKCPTGPPLAGLALKLTRQEWTKLSLNEGDPLTVATPDIDVLVERVTALLLVRIVACVAAPGTFPDGSTTMICTTYISKQKGAWPAQITPEVVAQLHHYVSRILSQYKDVPYHNREHAYHVILSVNKLLDMMCCCYSNLEGVGAPKKFKPPPSYGLRNDPLACFALVFAALIHDVEHQGIPNRTLATENDRLAVLYNDQSIAENWSLYIAFSELLQDEFTDLREVLFGKDIESPEHKERYALFRKMVINMVLSTDLASPERTQVGKSKWKEAFGEPHETVEAKLRAQKSRRRLTNTSAGSSPPNNSNSRGAEANPNLPTRNVFRRMTQESAVSELTTTATAKSEDSADAPPSPTRFQSLDEIDNESMSGTPDQSLDGNEGKLLESPPPKAVSSKRSDANNKPVSSIKATPTMQKRLSNLSTDSAMSENQPATARNNDFANLVASASEPPRKSLGSNSGNRSNDGSGGGSSRQSLNQFLNRSHHRFESRISRSSVSQSGRYRQRLGILRTVDLGGETLETYSRHDRHSSQATVAYSVEDVELDEPDELKMTVVMETILAAADVAHNLQSWSHMLKWSKRLYFELRRAHSAGRGVDVSRNWFENQIGFLESYVLPLARRLEDTGVWGDETTLPSKMFASIVEDLRDEWVSKGYEITQETIKEGEQQFPIN